MIDFEKVLKPIRDDAPAGDDLRYQDGDLTFHSIEELRVDEDPALTIEGDAKTANWPKVVHTCEDALANKAKDLEIAGFLAEGLAHTQGFEGVRDGLRLQKELIQAFWDGLHPGLDEGEVVLPIRAKPLNWLALPNGFLRAVKAIPFVTGNPERPLSMADLEMSERVDAAQLQSDPGAFEELTQQGYVTGEAWRLALANTPLEQLQASFDALLESVAELGELTQLCDERFGDEDAPRLMALSDVFDEIRERIEPMVQPAEAEGFEAEVGETGEASASAAGPAVATGPIASRQDALRTLGLVADFFRRTEPHTPISYLVQRAVRWGNMPLEDLLREVVKNDDALAHIWETLGITAEGEGSE
jgi:type VI secretion system protein ImpA